MACRVLSLFNHANRISNLALHSPGRHLTPKPVTISSRAINSTITPPSPADHIVHLSSRENHFSQTWAEVEEWAKMRQHLLAAEAEKVEDIIQIKLHGLCNDPSMRTEWQHRTMIGLLSEFRARADRTRGVTGSIDMLLEKVIQQLKNPSEDQEPGFDEEAKSKTTDKKVKYHDMEDEKNEEQEAKPEEVNPEVGPCRINKCQYHTRLVDKEAINTAELEHAELTEQEYSYNEYYWPRNDQAVSCDSTPAESR